MKNNGYRWLIAGSALGALGMYLGMGMHSGKNLGSNMRKTAAKMTTRMSKDAGDFIADMGHDLAGKMR